MIEHGMGFLLVAFRAYGGKVIEHGMGERMVRIELKYCERCGGLLLRRSGEAVVYCGPCDDKLRELPTAQGPRADSAEHLNPPLAVRIPPRSETFHTAQAAERRQA